MKQFKGRPVAAGKCTAKALVSHNGFNTLASFQKSLQFGDKTAKCGDQNNPDLFGKPMVGTALCLPQTIGSTTGGMVLYCAKVMGRTPACLLFSEQKRWRSRPHQRRLRPVRRCRRERKQKIGRFQW